jgi:hypothetical protein
MNRTSLIPPVRPRCWSAATWQREDEHSMPVMRFPLGRRKQVRENYVISFHSCLGNISTSRLHRSNMTLMRSFGQHTRPAYKAHLGSFKTSIVFPPAINPASRADPVWHYHTESWSESKNYKMTKNSDFIAGLQIIFSLIILHLIVLTQEGVAEIVLCHW